MADEIVGKDCKATAPSPAIFVNSRRFIVSQIVACIIHYLILQGWLCTEGPPPVGTVSFAIEPALVTGHNQSLVGHKLAFGSMSGLRLGSGQKQREDDSGYR